MRRLFMLALVLVPLGLAAKTGEANDEAKNRDDGVVHLFNGKDLTNFYTWLAAPRGEKQPLGKNNDPLKVFTVVDGAIRISGEVFGGFITEREYGDYRLNVEYKWGEKTYPPREKAARDSGILLHCQGEDGSASAWMPSIECQMIEGGTGDLIIIGNKQHPFRITAEVENRGGQTYYKPGATAREFTGGRVNWYARDPQWKDVKGFRGKDDIEKPVGEWNTYEIIADGDTITAILNGKTTAMGTKCNHTRGKILFQSEAAEVFFRRIDLKPLRK
ncbi:MAG TPA: DUF1080 domain-containing protein [Gemmataceae bacterium]|nr:DUF1080 domain-containing protein [Gemmataceae bacterium]